MYFFNEISMDEKLKQVVLVLMFWKTKNRGLFYISFDKFLMYQKLKLFGRLFLT